MLLIFYSSDLHQISVVENSNTPKAESQSNDEIGSERLAALLSGGAVDETSKESWFKDYEEVNEPPDAGEIEDQDSDYEDYEETYVKKKKKKPNSRGAVSVDILLFSSAFELFHRKDMCTGIEFRVFLGHNHFGLWC